MVGAPGPWVVGLARGEASENVGIDKSRGVVSGLPIAACDCRLPRWGGGGGGGGGCCSTGAWIEVPGAATGTPALGGGCGAEAC